MEANPTNTKNPVSFGQASIGTRRNSAATYALPRLGHLELLEVCQENFTLDGIVSVT